MPRLQGGINAVANAVKVTLGPKGRNVVLQRDSFQANFEGEWLSKLSSGLMNASCVAV